MHPLLYEFFDNECRREDAIRIHCALPEERAALRDLAAQYQTGFSDKYLMDQKYFRPEDSVHHNYFFWDTNMVGDIPHFGFNGYAFANEHTYEFKEFMSLISDGDDDIADMEDIL